MVLVNRLEHMVLALDQHVDWGQVEAHDIKTEVIIESLEHLMEGITNEGRMGVHST